MGQYTPIPKWVDMQFIQQIGYGIQRWHQTKEDTWYGRCPICGDSHKNQYKTRF